MRRGDDKQPSEADVAQQQLEMCALMVHSKRHYGNKWTPCKLDCQRTTEHGRRQAKLRSFPTQQKAGKLPVGVEMDRYKESIQPYVKTLADNAGLLALIAEIKDSPHADVGTHGHACHVGGDADQQLYHALANDEVTGITSDLHPQLPAAARQRTSGALIVKWLLLKL